MLGSILDQCFHFSRHLLRPQKTPSSFSQSAKSHCSLLLTPNPASDWHDLTRSLFGSCGGVNDIRIDVLGWHWHCFVCNTLFDQHLHCGTSPFAQWNTGTVQKHLHSGTVQNLFQPKKHGHTQILPWVLTGTVHIRSKTNFTICLIWVMLLSLRLISDWQSQLLGVGVSLIVASKKYSQSSFTLKAKRKTCACNLSTTMSQVFKLDYAEHICINWNAMCVCFEKQMNHPKHSFDSVFIIVLKLKPRHLSMLRLHC